MGFIEPDHEHGETDKERERNVDPEQVVDEFRVYVTRWYSCQPIVLASVYRWGMVGMILHTIVDSTDEDGGETEDSERNENTFHRILD